VMNRDANRPIGKMHYHVSIQVKYFTKLRDIFPRITEYHPLPSKNKDINVGQDTEVSIVPVSLVIVLYLRPDEQIGGQQFWSIQKLPCNRFERGSRKNAHKITPFLTCIGLFYG
jgi:hypothetical protein